MTGLRLVFAGLFGLAALLMLVGYALPSEMKGEATTTVNAEPERVFELLNSGEGWVRWLSWLKEADPSWTGSVPEGPRQGPGARMTWRTKSFGSGTVTITESEAPERVAYTMSRDKGGAELSGQLLIESSAAGGARVTWTEEAELKGALERWFALLSRSRVRGSMEHSLEQLRMIFQETPENKH